MGLRAGLDWCGKSRPTGIRSLDRPARRQSLYRLRYPALAEKRESYFHNGATVIYFVAFGMGEKMHGIQVTFISL